MRRLVPEGPNAPVFQIFVLLTFKVVAGVSIESRPDDTSLHCLPFRVLTQFLRTLKKHTCSPASLWSIEKYVTPRGKRVPASAGNGFFYCMLLISV